MKRKLLLCAVMVITTSVYAQEKHTNSKLSALDQQLAIMWADNKKDSALVRALISNAPQYFNAPSMPRFSVIGKDRKFYLGIGGYVKATISYDWGNPIVNSSHFTTSLIPMNQPAGNGGLVQFGAQSSTIDINFVGLPGTKDQIGAYFNFNFSNPGYGLSLLNCYLTYRGFTAGYNFSLFADVMAGPPTIDFEGPCGWTIIPNAVLDYNHTFNKHWSVGVGLEMPIASYTNGVDNYAVNQRVPDVPAFVQYSWGQGSSWLRLSGIVRNMLYHDTSVAKNENVVGWGVKLSGSAKILPKLTSFYQGVYGDGIASYMQDSYGLGLDMLPRRDAAQKLGNVAAWGGYVGLQWNFTKTFFMSCTYSMVKTDTANRIVSGDVYRGAQYVCMNVFWNLRSNVQMGAEYLWGDRRNHDNSFRSNNRLQTMIQVNF